MRIDKRLNIIIELPREDEGTLYVHATPIGREVFESYFLPMSIAFARLWGEGLTHIVGPRVALLMLRKISEERREWDGVEGVKNGLMEEVKRLTNVIVRTDAGWKTIPMYNAVEQKLLTEEETWTVENAICFFILASAIVPRKELTSILGLMNDLWGTRSVLFSCTEFAASLTTSTVAASSSENQTAAVSSVPS